MTGARKKRPRQPAPRAPHREISPAWAIAIPSVVAAILCLPRLGLGYFWDDFIFLTGRGAGSPTSFLFPDPGVAFYRPISQGLCFLLLKAIDPTSGTLGHVLNLLVLIASIALIVLLVSDLAGRRAGLASGLLLAGFGHMAGLVAWTSCNQDLLAIAFILAALLLRHRKNELGAIACAVAAMLCKEPAAAVLPLLFSWDWLVKRPMGRPGWRAGMYAVVLLGWIAIHPGLQVLASRGFQSGSTGYVGVEHPERWFGYLVRYLMTLANIPPIGLVPLWPDDLTIAAFIGVVGVVAGLILADRGPGVAADRPATAPAVRVAWIGLALAVPTLLMPVVLVRHWAPYFACIPAVGVAIAAAPWIARWSKAAVTAFFALFLLLGVLYRGTEAREEPVWCETVFVRAARAAATVRGNFRRVYPDLPPGSQVVVAVASTGTRGIKGTMIDNQALQVWYGDPSIRSVTTLNREPGATVEHLVRITTDLEVVAIDPMTGETRSSGGGQPDWTEVGRPLRNYAREVAADGETDRGILALDALSKLEPPEARPYNRRLVAMMLLAANRRDEALSLLAQTPAFPQQDALGLVRRLLAEASSSEALDLAAFEAFGLSSNDPETLRWMMREFQREGSLAQAAWWASKVTGLAPGDPEANSALGEARKAGLTPNRQPT